MSVAYADFLAAKAALATPSGLPCEPGDVHPLLKPHQRDTVVWAVRGGRRAVFASFGLGKTLIQLEIVRLCLAKSGGSRGLIVLPLGVRQEFVRDAALIGLAPRFIRSIDEADAPGIYLTNYESVRDGKLDPTGFDVVSLDEAAVLRGFGGTKTFREFMRLYEGSSRYRFVATATPSPNEYIELLAYAAFLDVMDVGQAKTRFFKRDSTKADRLTLHPHMERPFWLWVASWAIFLSKPSDLCGCECHSEQTSPAGASDGSSSSDGIRPRSGTAPGDASATAATQRPSRRTTSRAAASSPADAPDQPATAAKGPAPTASGAAWSIDAPAPTTRTGPTTVAAGSRSATDGGPASPTSSPTWDSRPPAPRSTGSTTTVLTSPATVDGQAARSRRTTGDLAPDGGARTWCDACRCDEGYQLPPLTVEWHELPVAGDPSDFDRRGRGRMFRNAALGVSEASREKRESIEARVAAAASLIASMPADDQVVVWCDLNEEQHSLERHMARIGASVTSLYGATDVDVREERIEQWRNRETRVFLSKPSMYGAGVNLQQAHQMVFAGIGFKFSEVIQAVHREFRFLQEHPVTVHLIYTEAEREVRVLLERKWVAHNAMVARMGEIIREYGLAHEAMAASLRRSIGVERQEVAGDGYRLVNADAVEETAAMPADSVDLIVTSIPFATQYEYTPSYNDFGHTEDNDHFWRQMDYLTPELLRVLQPGRVAAIHVKDRIVPGGMTGLGFQTVQPFHAEAIAHYSRHGFAFLGMKTIVTDVVRENNQTYRLGWTEQCKDGSRMGAGLPEYLLIFRKPPTDRSRGYADTPVVKSKAEYSRSRWQVDAHGFMRSNGNRPLTPEDIEGIPHDQIFRLFREHGLTNVYDFEQHVRLGEAMEAKGRLPVTFMLLQPPSWHPDVWTDVARMRTLNLNQHQKGQEFHLCPLQFDIVDRLVAQFSMPGETVYDPFGGLMTVPFCAVKLGRRAIGVELNPTYFRDGVAYVEAAAMQANAPTLFDLLEVPA